MGIRALTAWGREAALRDPVRVGGSGLRVYESFPTAPLCTWIQRGARLSAAAPVALHLPQLGPVLPSAKPQVASAPSGSPDAWVVSWFLQAAPRELGQALGLICSMGLGRTRDRAGPGPPPDRGRSGKAGASTAGPCREGLFMGGLCVCPVGWGVFPTDCVCSL